MVGVMITGHGEFPTGALTAVKLVAGVSENIVAVNFREGMSSEELKANMQKVMIEMPYDEILVLADLPGGTPFRTAAELKMALPEKQIRVVSGANLPCMVEAAFSSSFMGLDELTADVIENGKENFIDFDHMADDSEEPDFGEGL